MAGRGIQMQQNADTQATASPPQGIVRTLQQQTQQLPGTINAAAVPEQLVNENLDDEEMVDAAETYADYMPSKLKIGRQHPDAVVESSSLASVPHPDITYKVMLPEDTINSGSLSALQLEAVTYACQQHERILPNGSRAGYLIGDGTGVGKGRILSAVIHESYLRGRKKSIWISASSDLHASAERDLASIAAGKISVYALEDFKYGKKIDSVANGSFKKGVIFSTYSALIGEARSKGDLGTRLKQIVDWCGEDFEGVIIFDECHRAKNLVPTGSTKATKTGLTVLDLQKKLPKARIIYASATGASEPRNMAYMVRLGLWGPGTPYAGMFSSLFLFLLLVFIYVFSTFVF